MDKKKLERQKISAAKDLEKARQRVRDQGQSVSRTDLKSLQDAEKCYDRAKAALDSAS